MLEERITLEQLTSPIGFSPTIKLQDEQFCQFSPDILKLGVMNKEQI